MGVHDVQFKTLTCDNCQKTVTYEHPKDQKTIGDEHSWLRTTRYIQTVDGRLFLYCSDLCEVSGIEKGSHNIIEQPKVEIPAGGAQAQIMAAAAAAARQAEANKAIKEGSPITLK